MDADVQNSRDKLIARALSASAAKLRPNPTKASFVEVLLDQAIAKAIRELEPGANVEVTGHNHPRPPIPDWVGDMRDFDLKATLPGEASPSILIEDKVDDIKWTLWDLLKLAAGLKIVGVEAAYLVGAAWPKRWASDHPCVALFSAEPTARTWDSRWMLRTWATAWEELLRPGKGGPARPTVIPAAVETVFLGRATSQAFPSHEIRALAIRRSPDVEEIQLSDGRLTSG